MDIGTGDDRFVYRSAHAHPDRFFIGIDVQPKALEKISEKIHRGPEKGGLPNVLFVQAPVEELPSELDRVANEPHSFSVGSLLRAVVLGDEEVLAGLRQIAVSGSWLELVLGVDEGKDAAEAARLKLLALTEHYLRSTMTPRYEAAGFDVQQCGIIPPSEWPQLDTTWAKRLRDKRRRRLPLRCRQG